MRTILKSAVSAATLIAMEVNKVNSTDLSTLAHGDQAVFLTNIKIDPADMPGLLADLDRRKVEIADEDGAYVEQATQKIDMVIYHLGAQVRGYANMLKRFETTGVDETGLQAGDPSLALARHDGGYDGVDPAIADKALARDGRRPNGHANMTE